MIAHSSTSSKTFSFKWTDKTSGSIEIARTVYSPSRVAVLDPTFTSGSRGDKMGCQARSAVVRLLECGDSSPLSVERDKNGNAPVALGAGMAVLLFQMKKARESP
jgi:hypothetical protein